MRLALLLVAMLALAGCGGDSSGPHLARADAAGLISLTHRIADETTCAQAHDIPKLRARAVALVNARRVPAALQEPLLSGVNALASTQPVCLPTTPASSTTPVVIRRVPAPRAHGHPHPPHPHGPPKHHK
jgi:hypothetical protein